MWWHIGSGLELHSERDDEMKREAFEMVARLERLGFTYQEANQLRRISMTLRNWFELECGTENAAGSSISIEREENGEGKPFQRVQFMGCDGKWIDRRFPVADRESGARRRLARIMESRKRRLVAYVQTDCRGASLYILRKADVRGQDINSIYNRGVTLRNSSLSIML